MVDDNSSKKDSAVNAGDDDATTTASWFDAMMSRRQFGLAAAASVAAAGLGTSVVAGCTTDPNRDTQDYRDADAIEFQREEGWDFGARNAYLPLRDGRNTDVAGGERWKEFNSRDGLLGLTAATAVGMELSAKTLFESVDTESKGKRLGDAIRPMFRDSMEESYQQGAALAHLLHSQKVDANTLVVLDLPGPESVAAAAGMSSLFAPAFYFDNWPHPHGVVPAQETLGATLYYAPELSDASKDRSTSAPPVMVLDRNRLNEPNAQDSTAFDNRYGVLMPSQQWVKEQGFERVLYVVPTEKDELELDDLNEDFSVFTQVGIPVERLALSEFQPASPAALQEAQSAYADQQERLAKGETLDPDEAVPELDDARETKAQEYHEHRHYHYGGSPFGSYFFLWYMMSMRPMGYAGIPRSMPASGRVRAPRAYTPRPRPTAFSTRYSGTNLSNVGRQRPTGLGRVTAPVNRGSNRASGAYVGAGAAAAMRTQRARVGGGGSGAAPRSTPSRNHGSPGRGVYNTGG